MKKAYIKKGREKEYMKEYNARYYKEKKKQQIVKSNKPKLMVPQKPEESLVETIREAIGSYKNVCNPMDLERMKVIWNAVVEDSREKNMEPRKESVLEVSNKEELRRILVTPAKSVGGTLSKPLCYGWYSKPVKKDH